MTAAGPSAPPPPREDADVEETALLDGRVRLLQPVRGYRVAFDPVLLAAAVPLTGPGRTARVLDAGTGTGAAALCLLARAGADVRAGLQVVGLEIEATVATLAARSAALNGWADRLEILTGDLCAPPAALTAAPFDAVLTNPPYLEDGTPSPDAGRARAHATVVPLEHWVGACLDRLRPKGRFVVIHRADRIDALLAALHGRAGAAEILPLWPGPGSDGGPRPARRVIVRARKGVRGPATLWPGLVLHTPDGPPTAAADAVLRHGCSLDDAMTGQRG
ncbi:methyltransferase [Roseospira marina]|uniref:Methyltransferase n=1 Tax=Roseospira marina TaxID=140057 RepID=A0A5M6I8A5_9PROT|nr:methyltransferase [Roseospira marina]KAA5604490.1 methyltransferase [Roseospira marina]MBB4315542.1 tRNA1(Val) A37 N6-methylase TrmN6 [Roseospira marina]MBB5088521.1 tRNA1(Val) A37 N6-methylase TrmN6 [Roseospira marina]